MENRDLAIDRLRVQMARGEVILFTGAGFSAGAANRLGEPVPQGGALKRAIWELVEPGEEPDEGSTLADTYATALAEGRNRLTELLKRRLDVSPDSLTEVHERWLVMPWRRAYTLNIDNLEVAAQRRFDFPRSIRPHSGLSTGLPTATGGDLLYTHLNGTLEDVPDVTFAEPQYGQRHLQENPLYQQLAADLLSYPAVFVGTELRESLLWQYVALRDKRGARGIREMRPLSFLVTPSLPRDRQRMLGAFNIRWIPATTEEFAREVLTELGDAPDRGHAIRRQAASVPGEVILPRVSELATQPQAPTSEYLLGAEPTWGDLTSGRAVEREFERSLDMKELAQCVVVAGTAGAGTSTTLMRLALRLAAEDENVRWLGADHEFETHQLARSLVRHDDELTLVIDDADTFGRALRDLIVDLRRDAPHVRLVIGMRTARIDPMLGDSGNGAEWSEVNVPPLEDSDIELLLDTLERDNKLGALKPLSSEQRVDRIRKECNRELLVAMIEATSGERFELKVAEEFDSLEGVQRTIYAAAAIATDLRFGLTKDELLIACGDVTNTALFGLDRLIGRHLLSVHKEAIRVRHRRLAELIVARLRRSAQMVGPYTGLVRAMAIRANPDDRRSREAKFLTALISHVRIGRMFSIADARTIYESAEDQLRNSYHYWLQRGALEVQHGNIRLAGNFLQQARAGEGSNDYRVETEWAYYLLKSAYLEPESSQATDRVAEAKEILLEQIEHRGARDVHVWHVFGSQMLAWTRRARIGVDERRQELQLIKDKLSEALRAHPHASELQKLHREIEREWLMTAVPE